VAFGWYSVFAKSRSLEASTVATYQAAQLEVVRTAARAAQSYITGELERRSKTAIPKIEQEVLNLFVKPIRIGRVGDAWIYAPTRVVFDESEDFPAAYRGKSMAAIFALQKQSGARHYEEMTAAVMRGREGTGWYVWEPDKARAATPWWEHLTQDAGLEIAAWSPVVVFPGTEREITWTIGMSAMLPELMRANGAYAQIQSSIVATSVMTAAVIVLLALLRRSQRALHNSEAHYRAIVEDQTEFICRFQRDGTLTFVNQAYANACGTEAEQLVGASIYELMASEERPVAAAHFASLSSDKPVNVYERPVVGTERETSWQQWTDRAILDEWGQVVEIQAVGRDITERKIYEAEIERLAFTDSLTGLANRRCLYSRGDAALKAMTETQTGLALIYLDLNRFKPVNDTLGHDAGDELLAQVGARLRLCIRKGDTLARLGGDEFAVLLTPSDTEEACTVANRILAALEQPFYLRGRAMHVGGSLGIALAAQVGTSFSHLLTQADMAMYRAKTLGGSRYTIFEPDLHSEAIARLELGTDLHRALTVPELQVYYQPIVLLETGQIAGFEALVRWQHPQQGLLEPAAFLPIAEEFELAIAIDRWVLDCACRQMAVWQTQIAPPFPLVVYVNLSGNHLGQPDLVEYVEQLIDTTGLQPRHLNLEVAEDVAIRQTELATHSLARLRRLGVKISLDDFGTGYSSLHYLHRLPVDALKLDRSFVRELDSGSQTGEIVRIVNTLACSLGVKTVAEGIETEAQLAQLRALDYTYGQGFLFAAPLAVAEATALLAQQASERSACR
jgi:diguanylate cyclase (GGDEF)-like protein/PAS domain S-box-containing protein